MIESFGGVDFRVTSVSNIVADCESIAFVSEDGPNVAVTMRDGDPTKSLYVSVDGEVEATALLRMIAHSRKRFGLADPAE